MDNFRFDMTCEGRDRLQDAFRLAWNAAGHGGSKLVASHYEIRQATSGENPGFLYGDPTAKPVRMVFFFSPDPAALSEKTAFPFRMDADGAADFAARWLAEVKYPKEPDHDGDNERGWRLRTDEQGHSGEDLYSIAVVAPVWIMYGK